MPYTVNDDLDPNNLPNPTNIIKAINLLAYQIKQITGKESWLVKPDISISQLYVVPVQEHTLSYVSDGDTNGVFYYLGTSKGTQGWINPHNSGALEISMSSKLAGFDTTIMESRVVDRHPTDQIATNNVPDGYIDIDLKTARLKLKDYTVLGRNWSDNHPFHWLVKGSNDQTMWTTLQDRNGAALIQNTWDHEDVNSSTAYRYFRFQQVGINASSQYYFCIGGLELYGDISFS
ncbi:hypothetical protein [Nostoc sp. 106C]|uniref:hypothetical protein n=1 Tax=Nostoc sp. 106C TaxID=1932667 RepID=UPI000A3739A0|nr:hypothetical protein [Nostoc sp. 106C]OUL28777.1 hypothetical protein BV375_16805 [Nostoc sp. 106C]